MNRVLGIMELTRGIFTLPFKEASIDFAKELCMPILANQFFPSTGDYIKLQLSQDKTRSTNAAFNSDAVSDTVRREALFVPCSPGVNRIYRTCMLIYGDCLPFPKQKDFHEYARSSNKYHGSVLSR